MDNHAAGADGVDLVVPVDNGLHERPRSCTMSSVHLRLSYPDGHRLRTVSARVPPGTTWAGLAAVLGLPPERRLVAEYAGAQVPLTPDLIVGSPPLVQGVTIAPAAGTGTRHAARAPVAVQVTAGPDVGGCYGLRPGHRLTVGRGQWCDVVLDDAELSRHHLTIWTTREGVLVDDASSTNGTELGGLPVDGPTVWPPGRPLRAGASTLSLSPDVAGLPRGRPDGSARVVLTPRRRRPPALQPVALKIPEPTTPTAPVRPSALGWLLPLLVSVLLAVVLSMPALMLFGLMAPAMSLGGYAGERRRFRRDCAATQESHRAAAAAVREAAREAVGQETWCRQERVPDLARLIQDAQTTGDCLWSRAIDPLLCRIGLGPVITTVSVDGIPETAERVPIEVDLTRGLVVVGPPEVTRSIARSVLLQLAVLHSPSDLRVSVAGRPGPREAVPPTGPESPWDWLAWLPHAQSPSATGVVSTVRLYDLTDDTDTWPADELSSGIPIILCRTMSQAPDLASTLIVAASTAELRTEGHHHVVVPDRVSRQRATRVARTLASLLDAGEHGDGPGLVPGQVDFPSVAPVPTEAAALAQSWRLRPRSTTFVLGRGATDIVTLDLVTDGPHALVAGTTGSGKSELLRTLVTSLALVNRPDELVMVLVDYKGGSAFAEAAALPHVVGVITDLDPHLADRALTSLTAELKRRERILADAGAPDLPAYQDLTGHHPLPRLVLVIDEFRALAEELPGFLDGLVRIAALGRSLGVHLVLATQRPGGVVSADVRANVNLRIALRVRDGSDSYDVIDSPAAADLPEGLPGRALIRTGASAPREVQVASTSTEHRPDGAGTSQGISVRPVPDLWSEDVHPLTPVPLEEEDPQESTLARAAAAATQAAERLGAAAPPSPWLPALPSLIPLADLSGSGGQPHGEDTTYSLPLMLTDLPAQQSQAVHHWRPLTDGHLGIVGAARTGRSTLVRTVLAQALSRSPEDLHSYVFDLAGALGPLSEALHVGAVLTATDVARGCRVIEHLVGLVASRQRDLAASGHTSLSEQRTAGDHPWPLVVLAIDGWPRFVELFGEADRGRPLEQVLQLLREGLAVGVVALITGDRSLLSGRIAPLVPEMWSLRLTDSSDLLMAGLTRAQVPVSMPPGRVIRLRDGVVGQVAVVGSSGEGAAQVSALTALVGQGPPASSSQCGPARFRALPRAVAVGQIPAPERGLLVGVGGDAAEAVVLPVEGQTPVIVGVLGPPGSGRSTTLATLTESARRLGWTVVPVGAEEVRAPSILDSVLREAREAGVGALVTVDGLDRIAQTGVEDALLTWVEGPLPPGEVAPRALVVAGGPDDFGGFRGLGARVQRERTGIVLQPSSPTDGSPLGVTVPTGDQPLPGRGVLVLRGRCIGLQVAHPDREKD